MAKSTNLLPPFAPVDLRVWIEGDSHERDIVGAIRLIHWLEGPDLEIYLDQIVAACHPLGERTVKRALASARAKGWAVSKRKKKAEGRGLDAPTYQLAIEPMAFKTARAVFHQRANLASRSERPTGQIVLTYGPKSTDQQDTGGPFSIKEKDLRERLEERKTLPADAGGDRFKKPVPEIRTYFATKYLQHHGEEMTAVNFDWISKVEDQLVRQHGIQKMKTRADNYFADPIRSTHAYHTWLTRSDDWAKPRPTLTYPSKDDYGPKRRLSDAAQLARQLGLRVEDDGG